MARIRSVHPGMFTDERYLALSIAAKAVWPGIWTEADDHGVFEWKPVTFKAKLMPVDNVDMAALLLEMVEVGLVLRFTDSGKQYGVVKGFLKWQRPREPSYRFPFPHEAQLFANNSDTPAAVLPQDQCRTAPIASQREEEGGKREEVTDSSLRSESGADAPKSDPIKVLFDEGVKLLTEHDCKPANARSLVAKWRNEHGDAAVMAAFGAFRASSSTEPISWITQRFAGKSRETWRERQVREAEAAIDKALQ